LGQFILDDAYLLVGKANFAPVLLKKLPVQSGKEPALHLRLVSYLVAFIRPDKKCLLSKIGRVGFIAHKPVSKAI